MNNGFETNEQNYFFKNFTFEGNYAKEIGGGISLQCNPYEEF